LCSCMEESLTCAVKESVPEKKIGELFGNVCGYGVCDGLAHNATKGKFGAYSMCSPRQQLSFVMDKYYFNEGREEQSACDFDGAARTKKAKNSIGSCSYLIKQAGSGGSVTDSSEHRRVSSSSDASNVMADPYSIQVGVWQV